MVFIGGFLQVERDRHIKTAERSATLMELWQSEAVRQLEEVKHIDEGIAEVNKRFGWEKK